MSSAKRGERGSRTEEVYRFLLDAIKVGEYGQGSRLPSENALATKLGVSRPVVREAVSKLAAEGLVRAEQGRGTFVSKLLTISQLHFSPIEGVEDLIAWQDLRIAIEQEAARLAAERCTADDLEKIRDLHLKLINLAKVGDRAIDLDFEFHLSIAKATQNSILVNAQRSLGEHIRNWMSTLVRATNPSPLEWPEYRYREHLAIVEAIQRMDPDAAAQAARRHLENGRTRLLTELSGARHS
ncbi:MAG: FadR family transcriptional regulator [SAR324 cluster bacterium]|nr:FadR family transcriptional regulator [SAR324 cluster bacterium]